MVAHPKKSLGQHFLRDAHFAERAADAAAVGPGDVALEIGPGPGVLTRVLAARAREVVAIELDRDLARNLAASAPANVRVVHADALEAELPRFDACVSNLPYQISSPITFRLLATAGWRVAVLMFQREFAERLRAAPGTPEYGRLTVAVAYRAQAEVVAKVPPGAFTPPPKVHSALVRLVPRPPPFRVLDERLFFAVVQAAFTQRRKQLANALGNAAHLLPAARDAVRDAIPRIPHLTRRPGELSPAEFGEVSDALSLALSERARS